MLRFKVPGGRRSGPDSAPPKLIAAATCTLAMFATLGAPACPAEDAGPLVDALAGTRPLLDVRVRSESVEQAGFAKDAEALTVRARAGLETGALLDTRLLAEANLMWPLIGDYNSTVNGRTRFPTVPDPENYALNRLQLTNTSLPDTTVTLGRQRMNLDDQRFVGSVDWRQNEQTFDALRIVNKSVARLTVDVTWLNQVNRVFTRASPVGRYTGDGFLVNAGYETPLGRLTLFEYLLDLQQSPKDSSRTSGIRLAGHRTVGEIGLDYVGSWASQSAYAANPVHDTEGYYLAQLTGSYAGWSLGTSLETLQGNGIRAFGTPLATFHRFDGWADKFLVTPPAGLQQRSASLGYSTRGVAGLDSVSGTALYRDFSADHGSRHYGSEVDFLLQAKWRRLLCLLEFADYSADHLATDTRKLWLELNYVW